MTNEQVIAGLKVGDERVLKYLFDTRHLVYMNEAYKILHDHDKVRDVVMEAYISLWNKRSDFDSVQEIKRYLMVCSVNKSMNILRNGIRERARHQKLIASLETEVDPDLVTEVNNKPTLEKIAFISKRLSEKESELFTCEILHDISTREIAKMMNVTMDTIRSMRYRINKKIAAMRPELQKAFY